MEKIDVIKNIAKRTGGDIYLGVVGAVRTGKSTFIRRFMENMVIPNIPDEFDKNVWTVEGEPTTTITVEKPDTVRLTCGTIVNRIPDVISAKPGYVPTEKISELNYKIMIEK